MSLRLKVNIVMLAAFAVGLLLTAAFVQRLTAAAARRSVLAQASLMMGEADATLHYTAEQVSPLLSRSSRVQFLPQSIPFYATQQVFDRMASGFPGYSFRQPAPNPTNPRDRPSSLEASIIEEFAAQPKLATQVTERSTPDGGVLSLSQPIRVSDASCLACHSTPDAAPPQMLEVYGRAGGFGWKLGSVIGADIVSVPLDVPRQQARRDLLLVMGGLTVVFLVMLALLNLMLHRLILVPVRRIARLADEVSLGNMALPELNEAARDEIGGLSRAFNRMRRSLVAAIGLLEQ